MFDVRYHAVTVLGVLVALVLGLLLGTAIGDAGLVSSAEQRLRSSLREDVQAAEERRIEVEQTLERRDAFGRQARPLLVADRLRGRRIALVALGRTEDDTVTAVRDVLREAGAELTPVVTVRTPPDLAGLAEAVAGTRYAPLDRSAPVLEAYGERVARQLVAGPGELLLRTGGALLRSREGEVRRAAGVVVLRDEPAVADADAAAGDGGAARATAILERGIGDGLAATGVPAVGVQPAGASDDALAWFTDRGLSSVEEVAEPQGQVALALLLAGGARGRYGGGPDADGVLPVGPG